MLVSPGLQATDTTPTSDSLLSLREGQAAPAAVRVRRLSTADRAAVAAVSTQHPRRHPCCCCCCHSGMQDRDSSGHRGSRHRLAGLIAAGCRQVSRRHGSLHSPVLHVTPCQHVRVHCTHLYYYYMSHLANMSHFTALTCITCHTLPTCNGLLY